MQRDADQSSVAVKTPQRIGAGKTPVASPLRAGHTGPEPILKYLRTHLPLLAGLVITALFALVGAPDAAAQATAPELIHFQGRLTDENGVPANGATYDFELRFYSIDDTVDPPSGDCYLVDTHNNVTVTNGVYVFDVGGGVLAAPGDGGDEYTTVVAMFQNKSTVWLQVTVSDGIVAPENLYPRTRMMSSAYAQNANMVDGKHYLSAAPTPSATIAGDLWYDTTNNRFKYWNGTGWQTVGTSDERWSDGGAWIYPTDAGDYGSTGVRVTDAGGLSMNGSLTADGTINTASSYQINGTRILAMPVGTTNICVGAEAGDNLSANADSTFVGYRAGNSNTTGPSNTFVGREAGFANQTGDGNTFVGYQAGLASITQYNTMVGYKAGAATDGGGANAFFGWQTAMSNTSGERNTLLGTEAGSASTIGNRNTFVGFRAGTTNVDGSDNVCIGCGSNLGAGNLTNATAIGYAAQVDQSNSMVLGNGVNVGIGTTAPSNRLDVRTNDATANATTNLLRLAHNTTGAPAAGLGTGIIFTGESSTTENRDMAQIDGVWSTVADATRSAALRFLTVNNAGALSERMRLNPDGTLTIGLPNDNPGALFAYTTVAGGYGLYAENGNSGIGDDAYGVKGMATGANGGTHYAVMGEASGAAMSNYGLYGTGISAGTSTAYGIYATASGTGTNWAAYFVGDTAIGSGGNLVLYDSDSTHSISIRTPATGDLTTSYFLVLPTDNGAAGQLLRTDGSGVMSWTSDIPGSDNDYIQNQSAGPQASASFWIDGTAQVDGAAINLGTTDLARAINIGTGGLADTINIGTGAVTADAISIGNAVGATSVAVNAGTGDFTLTSTDDVTINGGGASAAINIGTVATAHTITMGNSTGATSLVLNSGTGAINIGTNAIAHTITLGNSTG
ncbi:MAG: hypothetical protein RDV41_06840, partial [Planctomycetota bacterium]|nr:hypothetical protein [Planctomycetota bacterium]